MQSNAGSMQKELNNDVRQELIFKPIMRRREATVMLFKECLPLSTITTDNICTKKGNSSIKSKVYNQEGFQIKSGL